MVVPYQPNAMFIKSVDYLFNVEHSKYIYMKFKGFKIGLIFFGLSLLLTVTFVGPIYIPMFAEGVGSSIDRSFNIGNIGGTTFYTCVIICVVCFIIYVLTFVKYKEKSSPVLVLFFISVFIFLNAALFYYNIRLPGVHIDGQQFFDSVDKPVKTCLLYPILGFGHDLIMNRFNHSLSSNKSIS